MSNKNDFYSSSGSSEISIRDEFYNTMYGFYPEIAKHQKGLLRRFRRDSSENLINCPCVDKVTQEPDRETKCPVCLGEGKLWDEEPIQFYHVSANQLRATSQDVLQKPGIMNTNTEVIYISSQFNLTKDDKIVYLRLDKEGFPIAPLKRNQLFRISDLQEKRLDNGRLEFWKAYCYEDSNKFL